MGIGGWCPDLIRKGRKEPLGFHPLCAFVSFVVHEIWTQRHSLMMGHCEANPGDARRTEPPPTPASPAIGPRSNTADRGCQDRAS